MIGCSRLATKIFGLKLPAHELTHAVQQTGSSTSDKQAQRVQRTPGTMLQGEFTEAGSWSGFCAFWQSLEPTGGPVCKLLPRAIAGGHGPEFREPADLHVSP